jgi:nitroreductase
MMLEAQDLVLGTTWVCWFDTAKVREAFDIPEKYEPRVLLPVGYPGEKGVPAPAHSVRKNIEEYYTEL